MSQPTFFGNHLQVRYTFMALHAALLVFLLVFTVITTHDLLFLIYHCCQIFFVLVYMIPVAILCWRNRESKYERGWVEILFLTWQTLWAMVCVIWVGLLRRPDICAGATANTELPFLTPYWGPRGWQNDVSGKYVCKALIVTAVFSGLNLLVTAAWFGWTLWLTTKVAQTMGSPWTRDTVLKRVSMGKMAKLHQWREGEELGMGKVRSESPSAPRVTEERYRPQKHNKFNGLMA